MVVEGTTLASFVKIKPTVPAAILTNESKVRNVSLPFGKEKNGNKIKGMNKISVL